MTTLALLPIHLTKAFVRGHLRNLGGRMVEVKPYHTKTQPKRDDDRTREMFGDIPQAGNQIQPRMHPARTTTPRTPVIPFKAALPQLFHDGEGEKPEPEKTPKGQRRAKPGGEMGPNGEWYEGGKFIATTEQPKKPGGGKSSGKEPVGPYEWALPPTEGARSIFAVWSGLWKPKVGGGYELNDRASPEYFGKEVLEEARLFADRYNAGERWYNKEPLASVQNGQYNQDTKGRNPAPATEGTKMDSHHDPIHGYTDSVAQLEEDQAQTRKLRREMADAKAAEDADWTEAATESRRATWNEWLKQANGRKLSAKEIAEQEKRQGFTVDTLKRHVARHGVDKRRVETKATLLKEMEKDRKTAEGTPISADIETVIDLIRMTDPENRPFSDTLKAKWSKGEEAAFNRFQAWKKEQNATKKPPDTTPPAPAATASPRLSAAADRIYLTVPFSEKDRVKAKGAKWDGDKKKWYWPTSAGEMPAVVKGYAK